MTRCKTCGQEIIKRRTNQANRALHLFYTQLAEVLNEAGLEIRTTLKEDFDVPWSALTVKEFLWRPLQKSYMQEQSTTRLTSKAIDVIYNTLVRELGTRKGIEVPPFPSIETLMNYENH